VLLKNSPISSRNSWYSTTFFSLMLVTDRVLGQTRRNLAAKNIWNFFVQNVYKKIYLHMCC